LTGVFSYLNALPTMFDSKVDLKTPNDLLCLEFLDKVLAMRAAFRIRNTATKVMGSKLSENEKVNSVFAVDIVSMAHTHITYLMFSAFKQGIEKQEFVTCTKAKGHLSNLAKLFGLYELTKDSIPLYECGFFKAGTASLIQEALKIVLKDLRPHMIPLVESFGIPDSMLVSAIGNSYGDIYE
jgi:acyl-CoA oxidase